MTKLCVATLASILLFAAACSSRGITTNRPDAATGAADTTLPTLPDAETYTRTATSVAIGRFSACAIVSGSVYCWGGLGGNATGLTPLRVDGLGTPAMAVAVGDKESCAIVKGELLCWVGSKPVAKVAGLPAEVTAIAAGPFSNCALAGGKAYCWGRNNHGQLGDGSTTDSTTPVQVQGLPGEIVAIRVGELFTCAIAAGAVYCWGGNNEGELGNGTLKDSALPLKVQNLPASVTAIAAGFLHACALADGAAYCWGYNLDGQLGTSAAGAHPLPAEVAGLGAVTAISANCHTTCALAGDVYCWGAQAFPNIDTQQDFETAPVPVGLSSTVSTLSAGERAGCAITNGTIYCWGYNYYGQLGDGTQAPSKAPVKVDFSTYF